MAAIAAGAPPAEAPHPSAAPETADAVAGGGATRMAVQVHRATPEERLALPPDASNTPPMDPLMMALAQLVRDRWAAEQRERAAQRARLVVVEGK